MPYIPQEQRECLECDQCGAVCWSPHPGDLNYAITVLLREHLGGLQRNGTRVTYRHLNDCLGALEGAKLEFYRRVVVPFEERKRAENGDVYDV